MLGVGKAWGAAAIGWLVGGAGCNVRAVDEDPIPAEVRTYARERCLRLEQCECSNATFGDRAECEARIVEIYEESVAGQEGVVLECFAHGARQWQVGACDDLPQAADCNAIGRSQSVGTPCELNPFVDAYVHTHWCADGLSCFDGQCVEPVEGALADPCSSDALCERDLTCIGGRCELPRDEGEACETRWNCQPAQDLYCADGVCTTRTSTGDACVSRDECHAGVPCVEGRCTQYDPFVCTFAEI